MADASMIAGGLAETGGGFALGFLAGYAARRLIKIFLFVLGSAIVFGYLAEQGGYAKVNWTKVDETVRSIVAWMTEKLGGLASTAPGLGFLLGFLVGFTR